MSKLKKLNYKQKLFISEYLKNKGNATRAAMVAYKYKEDKTAAAIGSRLLRKANVQQAIATALKKDGIINPEEYIENKIYTIVEAGTSNSALKQAKVSDAITSLQFLAKLKNLTKKETQAKVSLHKHYHGMSQSELQKELQQIRTLTKEAIK